MTGRAKCVPGCVCLKHTPAPKRKCPEGCTCGKHNKQRRLNWDDPEVRKRYNRDMARKLRAADPERNRSAARRWHERNPYYRIAYKYNLTIGRWRTILDSQGGCCYLCGSFLDLSKPRAAHVDHDHRCCAGERSCGECIRGLTCDNCNRGVGMFGDSPECMRRVADALEAAQRKLNKQ